MPDAWRGRVERPRSTDLADAYSAANPSRPLSPFRRLNTSRAAEERALAGGYAVASQPSLRSALRFCGAFLATRLTPLGAKPPLPAPHTLFYRRFAFHSRPARLLRPFRRLNTSRAAEDVRPFYENNCQ